MSTSNPSRKPQQPSSPSRKPQESAAQDPGRSGTGHEENKRVDSPDPPQASTRGRGFAAMDPQRQREIARQGGRAAHRSGNAHEFDSQQARAAGRKGGEAISQNRAHMARIGARGGEARQRNRNEAGKDEGGEGDKP